LAWLLLKIKWRKELLPDRDGKALA
ncbi:MAG: hypothetical protein QOG27_992, partial [Verrucomicrobiota bacterium]